MALVNNDGPLTVEKIKEALREYDMIIRPKALVVSPRIKKELLEAEPMIEQRVVLVGYPACEDEKAVLIDRKDLKNYLEGVEDPKITGVGG